MKLYMIPVLAAALLVGACDSAKIDDKADQANQSVSNSSSSNNSMDEAAKNGVDWSSLDAFVGKYPVESGLLKNSAITADLKTLLGEKFAVLETNTQTGSPLQRDGSVLYMSGNKPHEGGSNAAYLLIDQATKSLEAGLWENGKLSTYKTKGTTIVRPKDVNIIIANSQ